MFGNYLKVALRNIYRYKGYSLLNVMGLAIGMTCAILILIWVVDECSYDRFHEHANQLYRIVTEAHYSENSQQFAFTPAPLSPALKEEIPALFIGVTENLIYIDWSHHLVIPDTDEKIKKAMEEIERIRDVCTRLEFRSLGAIAAGYAYHCFYRWINNKEKHMYNISVRDAINSTSRKR